VVLNGFRIPALSTRRTETEIELQDGQTFAIAGLMNNTMRSTMQKIPGIGDIPILGLLFKSKAAQKEQTELVVMITPHILPNNSRGVTPNLPRTPEEYMPALPDNRTHAPLPPAFNTDRPNGTAAVTTPNPAPGTVQNPANAAAAVKALTPGSPKVTTAQPTVTRTRPLTADEKRTLEAARREEQARAKLKALTDERDKAEDIRRQTAQIAADRQKADADRVQQEKAAREQKKRDIENARKAQAEAKLRAERDREQQKAIAEAESRLKAAEAQYNAELAKKNHE
jgi:hypothetical protein